MCEGFYLVVLHLRLGGTLRNVTKHHVFQEFDASLLLHMI